METGDAEGFVPQFCTITHLRAFEVMGEVSGHERDASCCLDRAVAAAKAVVQAPSETPLIQIQRRRPPVPPAV
jgi:hypothetical protein